MTALVEAPALQRAAARWGLQAQALLAHPSRGGSRWTGTGCRRLRAAGQRARWRRPLPWPPPEQRLPGPGQSRASLRSPGGRTCGARGAVPAGWMSSSSRARNAWVSNAQVHVCFNAGAALRYVRGVPRRTSWCLLKRNTAWRSVEHSTAQHSTALHVAAGRTQHSSLVGMLLLHVLQKRLFLRRVSEPHFVGTRSGARNCTAGVAVAAHRVKPACQMPQRQLKAEARRPSQKHAHRRASTSSVPAWFHSSQGPAPGEG